MGQQKTDGPGLAMLLNLPKDSMTPISPVLTQAKQQKLISVVTGTTGPSTRDRGAFFSFGCQRTDGIMPIRLLV